MKNNGVEVEEVAPKSAAAKAGLLAGDRLLVVNGERIRDSIDLMYCGGDPELDLTVLRGDRRLDIQLHSETGGDLGITLKSFPVRRCTNKCVFCFVSQLPKGMRKPLYLKDEDYRMSFLFGNYLTLTNLTEADRKRIVEQRLSPLYISVHSTNPDIRRTLLGNPKAGDILKDLRFFATSKIRMHTQIVLCPGYNDGKDLKKTINDLYKFYPYIESIAVVPVGLTAHRKKPLMPVGREEALAALEDIHRFQARFMRKHGEHIVFGADELYIKAGLDFPPLKNYDELPQIENGVGMVPLFQSQRKKVKLPPAETLKDKKFMTFTGLSFHPYLKRFIDRMRAHGIDIEAVGVENCFFGPSVTVTGLLTGRDVLRALSCVEHKGAILLIPNVVMKEGHEVFLDDVSRQDIEDILGMQTVIFDATPAGLVQALSDFGKH